MVLLRCVYEDYSTGKQASAEALKAEFNTRDIALIADTMFAEGEAAPAFQAYVNQRFKKPEERVEGHFIVLISPEWYSGTL